MNLKNVLPICGLSMSIALGCSSSPNVDLGDGEVGERGDLLSDYAAEWTGYAEAYTFPDETDVVRLTLDENGEGFLEFGDSSPVAPLDTEAPESVDYYDGTGYAYPVAATVEQGRLRLTVDADEPYRAWCEAQPPIELLDVDNNAGGGTYYACSPPGGRVPQGDGMCLYISKWDVAETTPDLWNCNALDVCESRCACDANGCTLDGSSRMAIDAAFEDENSLTGTWRVGLGNGERRVTIRLTKND